MPNPRKRFQKHKYIKTPKGVSKRKIIKKKTGKHKCAVCKASLHGVPHGLRESEVRKLTKTQRRPENLLASKLCTKCRDKVYQDAIMVRYDLKNKEDLDYRYRKYVDEIINKVEK